MKPKLIVGNWKLYGSWEIYESLLRHLAASSADPQRCRQVVCPPFTALALCQKILAGSTVSWGAQEVSCHVQGAYTGEVSASLLRHSGCRYVIVGHSERRTYHAETNEQVSTKALRVLEAGMTPIICVGETLTQRDAGQTQALLIKQLAPVLNALGAQMAQVVVAYEPVWAIGTGQAATPFQAQEVHAFLRTHIAQTIGEEAALQLPLIYGGSVKADNAAALFAQADIDGALVGGASVVAEQFDAIVRVAWEQGI